MPRPFAIGLACACDLIAQTPAHEDIERQLWNVVKQALNCPDGDEYFQSNIKDTMLLRLKGTLISALPTDSGNALVLGLTDSTTPEVGLLLHDLSTQPSPGAQIEFETIAIGFIRDPFLVMFDTDKDSIVVKPFGALAPSWYVGNPMGIVRSGRYLSHSGFERA